MKFVITTTFLAIMFVSQTGASEFNQQSVTFSFDSIAKCTACTAGTEALNSLLISNSTYNAVFNVLLDICNVVEKTIVKRDIHCEAYGNTMGPGWWSSVIGTINKERICNEALGVCSKSVIQEIDLQSVVDEILSTKPSQI